MTETRIATSVAGVYLVVAGLLVTPFLVAPDWGTMAVAVSATFPALFLIGPALSSMGDAPLFVLCVLLNATFLWTGVAFLAAMILPERPSERLSGRDEFSPGS